MHSVDQDPVVHCSRERGHCRAVRLCAVPCLWTRSSCRPVSRSRSMPTTFPARGRSRSVRTARSMSGRSRAGKVYAVIDQNQDGKADEVRTVAEGLNSPNGVAFRDGSLYVAEIHRILRFDDVAHIPSGPHKPVVITDALPRETHHGWKFIAFGPDGWLYVPVGAPCNICAPDPKKYANIMRMKPDGTRSRTLRLGCAQLGRIRLESAGPDPLVHRQRARHAGGRLAVLRAQPCTKGRDALRLPLLPRRDASRPAVRWQTQMQ